MQCNNSSFSLRMWSEKKKKEAAFWRFRFRIARTQFQILKDPLIFSLKSNRALVF
jgi:hypothetical protein